MTISLELDDDSDGAIRDRLLHLLIDENTRRVGEAHIDRSIICIKDDDSEEIQGGIWTELLFDWTYIEILFVPERLRGQGFATQLLKQAEAIAVSKGSVGMWLETFDFQAPDFYLKNGYEIFATLGDYPKGSNRRFLFKRFPRKHSAAD
ncbi:GNAT family N-acetyltransferase [Brucella pituitosa]|uniref:GNAT family N-acetyltransferase n=1 Tax=Brucella pituitosa TaxID=571256 RepID=UPI00137472E5|nr:GNAT family N-acetyltransferase [Brucella pituitosa]